MVNAMQNSHMMSTFFFPNDKAFQELLLSVSLDMEDLLEDVKSLKAILLYHVYESEARYVFSIDKREETLVMYSGQSIKIRKGLRSGALPSLVDEMGRDVTVLEADIPAGRSAIYIIDKVLLPEFRTVFDLLDHNPLGLFYATSAAIKRSQLDERYSNPDQPLVLLAPTDKAWNHLAASKNLTLSQLFKDKSLLQQILDRHTLKGNNVIDFGQELRELEVGNTVTKPSYMDQVNVSLSSSNNEGTTAISKQQPSHLYVAINGVEANIVTERMRGTGAWNVYGVDRVLL